MQQSDVQTGIIVLPSYGDLEGLEGYLVKLYNDSGTPKFALPTANDDPALFLLTDGMADAGDNVSAQPLSPDRSIRVKLEGTCSAGDTLVLADVATPADKGMVRKLPAVAGTYRGIAIAEETGVDGQFVKARPAMLGFITVL